MIESRASEELIFHRLANMPMSDIPVRHIRDSNRIQDTFLAQEVRLRMNASGLTQLELSWKANCSHTTISRVANAIGGAKKGRQILQTLRQITFIPELDAPDAEQSHDYLFA